jgi:DNA-binding LacI/PurR family transcriptional regulator
VSIRDVAAHAGVSMQTVSRVTNGKDVVAPATRERVLLAIQQLNYRPDTAARALRTGRVVASAEDFEEAERRGYIRLLVPAAHIPRLLGRADNP